MLLSNLPLDLYTSNSGFYVPLYTSCMDMAADLRSKLPMHAFVRQLYNKFLAASGVTGSSNDTYYVRVSRED